MRTASTADLFQEVARNDETLDLTRSLSDLADLRVAEHALDGILLGIPVAAVDLDRLDRGPHGQLRTEQLRHRGRLAERLTTLCEPGRMVDEMLPCLDFRGHVTQLELQSLKLGDRLAELLPLRRILQRLFKGAFGYTQ